MGKTGVLFDNEKNFICFIIIYCLYLYFQNYPLGDPVNNHHSCPCHPKNTGRKKKKQFWFSLGGFYKDFLGNQDEFSQKSNRGWRPLEQIQKT